IQRGWQTGTPCEGRDVARQVPSQTGSSLSSLVQKGNPWDHNGSIVSLYLSGKERYFFYSSPRPGLSVRRGTLLFNGTRSGQTYDGTAYVFSAVCGATA